MKNNKMNTVRPDILGKAARILTVMVLCASAVCLIMHKHMSFNGFYAVFSVFTLIFSRKDKNNRPKTMLYAVMTVACCAYVLVSFFLLGKVFGHTLGRILK